MRRRIMVTLVVLGIAVLASACGNGADHPARTSGSTAQFGADAPLPGVLVECPTAPPQYIQIKPAAMALGCPGYDNHGVTGITDVTWTSWGEDKASGLGSVVNGARDSSCVPSSTVQCGAAEYPATFTLRDPRQSADGPAFTRLSVEYNIVGPPDGTEHAQFNVPQPRK